MAEIIELPQEGGGTPEQQLRNMFGYLYRMAKSLNINFQQIGSSGLTDDEQELMNDMTRAMETPEEQKLYAGAHNYAEAETLKSLIIKTAQFVRDAVDVFRITLFGEESAEGQYGKWNRSKGLRVDVTPDGTKQTYSYSEIIKGLKTFEINSKNYIKTGFLRTENLLPVYGVAIGKDVVTFAEDGTETYNDSNKVAELTADALSFFHDNVIMAKYTGTKTSFYAGGVEVMYIQAGKIYSNVDLELGSGKSVKIGDWQFDDNGVIASLDTSEFEISETNRLTGNTGVRIKPSGKLDILVRAPRFGSYIEKEFTFQVAGEAGYMWQSNPLSGATDQAACLKGMYQLGTLIDPVHRTLTEIINAGNIEPWNKTNYGNGTDYEQQTFVYGSIGSSSHKWSHVYGYTIHYNSLDGPSSKEIKHDINDLTDEGKRLDQLRPVTFVYNDDEEKRKRAGLIFEEAIEVMPEICNGNRDDPAERKGINYVELIPYLLKEIQTLRARVKALEDKEE